MKILTVGNSSTYEVGAFKLVEKHLISMGHEIVLFRQDLCLAGDFLSFEITSGQPGYHIVVDGVSHNAQDFSAVWYMHPHLPKELQEMEQIELRPFVSKQFHSMRQGLWNLLRDRKWINDPWQASIAESKIWQLTVASEVGFCLPDTIVTSDPARVREFNKSHPEGIVVKLLGVSPLVGKVIYTNVVTAQYMAQIDSVKLSPAIFQVLLKKSHELRITVVGDKLFPVKIHSQEDIRTAIDWRTQPEVNDFDVRMEITTLPEAVKTKVFRLMKRLGLRYGCIDMVVTPDEDYVFLEINPSGQWHFVQLKTGALIAEALANLLVE